MRPLDQVSFINLFATSLISLSLTSCGPQGLDLAGLSGSASMQIEVEVYKGPLSKELSVQKRELFAKVNESQTVLNTLIGQNRLAMCELACFDRKAEKKEYHRYSVPDNDKNYENYSVPKMFAKDEIISRRKQGASEFCGSRSYDIEISRSTDQQHEVCNTLIDLDLNLIEVRDRAENLNLIEYDFFLFPGDVAVAVIPDEIKKDKTNCIKLGSELFRCTNKEILEMISGTAYFEKSSIFAEYMRSRAAFWATQQTAFAPASKTARRSIANYAQFLADYGNQIGARADAVLKQMAFDKDSRTIARDLLANSVYLRDSSPTSFLNLYKFNDASAATTKRGASDRIRLVEQLTADTYWTRINKVFASGQGNVTMAFVKDDIGNWDLKKFDNRPGELVDAYKQAGLAALQEVATLAASPANVGKAQKLLSFADRLNFGGNAPDTTQVDAKVASLRERTAARMTALGESEEKRYNDLGAKIIEQKSKVDQAEAELKEALQKEDEAKNALQLAQDNFDKTSSELAGLNGEKTALTKLLDVTAQEQQAPIMARISSADEQITVQEQISVNQQNLVESLLVLHKNEKDLAATVERKWNDENTNLAALKKQQEALPRETAQLIRGILDSYLTTLEEMAQVNTPSSTVDDSGTKVLTETENSE